MNWHWPPGLTLRPLVAWPIKVAAVHKASRFDSSLSDTLVILGRELRMLDSEDPGSPPAILQIALRETDLRIDGMPRAAAKPWYPGVILNIERPGRPVLSFPCDTFDHWHDNVRAIALTLEALRKIDRYGAAQTGQQYHGWQAIEAKRGVDATTSACVVLARVAWPHENDEHQANWAHKIATDPTIGRSTLRQARVKAHPDRHNGDRGLSDQVEGAVEVLRRNGIKWAS